MGKRRANWSEPGAADALVCLVVDDQKGNPHRQHPLPPALYSELVAPFLHFDSPLPNQLYVIGGRNQQQGPLNTVEMYDTWHGRWVASPSMSARRAGCGAAVLPDDRILCVGGYDENGIVKGLLATCEVFDPSTQVWDASVAPLEHARWGHGCASMQGLVYAVGGCSLRPGAPPREAFMETLRNCEVYDPETNAWQHTADLQMARAGSRVVAIGSQYLAAVGGCDDVFGRAEMLPTVELFDAATRRWTLLDVHLSTPRTTAAVAVMEDTRVLVIGGAPSLSTSEVFSLPEPLGRDADASGEEDTDAASGSARRPPIEVGDISEGRMGCQAATIQLPAPGREYPLCDRTCVLVVGGENGEEDWEGNQAHVRQFDSALVFDVEDGKWRTGESFPPMLVPRTAMAICVGHGYIQGYPRKECKETTEPTLSSRGGG